MQIRNAKNRSRTITAHVVDFCPANGCLWDNQFNVDVYGQAAWMALGGDLDAGNLEIEVDWPKDIIPNGSASVKLSFGLTVLMWNVLLLSL